jgi:hypothetical protein
MSSEEREMARALGNSSFCPGSSAKRFARSIDARSGEAEPTISEREAGYLRGLVYTYRRQIARDVVTLAGDVPQQRRDFNAQQDWRDRRAVMLEGAAALMSDGYRAPVYLPAPEENLDLFPVPRVVEMAS